MNSVLDLLYLRRPRLEYTSPPICDYLVPASGSGSSLMVEAVTPVSKPTGLAFDCANRRITWDRNSGVACDPAICFTVYFSVTQDGDYSVVAECVTDNSYVFSQSGYYRVSSISLQGESELSDPLFVNCGELLPPVALDPDDCTEITDSSFVAHWLTSPGATSYRLDVSLSPDFSSFVYDDVNVGDTDNFSVAGLTDGVTYYFRLRAENDDFVSVTSNVVSVTTFDAEVWDWATVRIPANSGTISCYTMRQANTFMLTIKDAGMREKIAHLNLMAGDQLAACQVPLVFDKGYAVDKLEGFLTSNSYTYTADPAGYEYNEQGILGGLRAKNEQVSENKAYFLGSGVVPAIDLVGSDVHVSFYLRDSYVENAHPIGCTIDRHGVPEPGIQVWCQVWGSAGTTYSSLWNSHDYVTSPDAVGRGLYTLTRNADPRFITYRNSTILASVSQLATPAFPDNEIILFGLFNEISNILSFVPSTKRIAGYSIGQCFDTAEVAAFNTAWQVFETAMNRNV